MVLNQGLRYQVWPLWYLAPASTLAFLLPSARLIYSHMQHTE